ncbi:MAG: ELM1/GtrOC1 family putative glycosyltransferase, partial [Actinomycetota bacterium]|nr:ELM1/GtrOC1 family putative glycosyltransferase [Actinomycetota bacterium]
MDASLESRRPRLVVWLVTDGKAGHRSQLEGLSRALARHAVIDAHWIPAPSRGVALRALLLNKFPPGDALPDPDLVVGCGHATHLPVLAARRARGTARGARSIVLMRPSLPLSWFDLCVIPQHDKPPLRDNVITTRGVLNTARASVHQKPTQGLFLIGGPSKHHKWDDKTLLTQIRQVVKETPDMRWALTTSRRTPEATTQALAALRRVGVEVIPFEKTDPGWVIDAITVSSKVWVTEDSVSMIYESLTSGAATGLLWVPRQ